jgi:hypothetical protein
VREQINLEGFFPPSRKKSLFRMILNKDLIRSLNYTESNLHSSGYMTVKRISAVALLVFASIAFACDTPVYRYALERWMPDPFDVIVFHQGPLPPEDGQFVEGLIKRGIDQRSGWYVREVDVKGKLDADTQKVYQKHKAGLKLPFVLIRQLEKNGQMDTIWKGAYTKDSLEKVLFSKDRTEISERLAKGDIVWVILEGSDPIKNQGVAKILDAELPKLQTHLKPSTPSAEKEPGEADTSLPPRPLTLSYIRVSKQNSAEEALVKFLLQAAPVKVQKSQDPLVFVIFGRGRAIYIGEAGEINYQTLESHGNFLVGPCSCEIKDQNPGRDLLFGVNWDELVEREDQKIIAAAQEKIEALDRQKQEEEKAAKNKILIRNVSMVIGIGVLLVFIYPFLRKRN